MISLGDNTEHDFTPKGCWTSCSESACHYWPLRFLPPERVRWRGGERLGEKWLSFFPSDDEVFWIPGVWQIWFSHEIISHLSFSITSPSVFINSISEKCMKCMALFPLSPSFSYSGFICSQRNAQMHRLSPSTNSECEHILLALVYSFPNALPLQTIPPAAIR